MLAHWLHRLRRMFSWPPRLVLLAPAAPNLLGPPESDQGRRLVPGGVRGVLQGRTMRQAVKVKGNVPLTGNRRPRKPARSHDVTRKGAVRVVSMTPGSPLPPHRDAEMEEQNPRTAGARRTCRSFPLFRFNPVTCPARPAVVGLAGGARAYLRSALLAGPPLAVPRTRTIRELQMPHLRPPFPVKLMRIVRLIEARGPGRVAFAHSGAADRATRPGSPREPWRRAGPAPRNSPSILPTRAGPPLTDEARLVGVGVLGPGVWRSPI